MVRILGLIVLPCLLCACQTPSERTAAFRLQWGSGAFAAAEAEIDALLAEENGIEPTAVGNASEDVVAIDAGDSCLFLAEKAMVRLARGDTGTALALLRRVRDELDERLVTDGAAYFKMFAASITDDTALDYPGADYEHIMVRVLLALTDLLEGGEDAYAYAEQVGEKQEEIIGSAFGSFEGEEDGYRPRESYRRVGTGAYLQGLIRELNLQADDACKAYRRADEYDPGNALFVSATERACEGNYVSAGNGVVHVFYLGGRGPHLEETTSLPTELALRLVELVILILEKDPVPIAQDFVPIPAVKVNDPAIPPIEVMVGDTRASTVTVLDVNQVATEQLEANMPWIIARAILRRVLKTLLSEGVRKGVAEGSDNKDLGKLIGAITNIALTATEVADTRNWNALPAQLQAVRLELPAGEHDVTFSTGAAARVRVFPGRDSYLVLLRPALGGPGVLLVDRDAQVDAVEPEPAPELAEPESPEP